MAIQDILAAVLNPNGVWDLGGPDNQARLAAAGSPLVAQSGAAMPQQAVPGGVPQQMPQQAPQAAPAQPGGGLGNIGDLLAGLFQPQSRGRNETINWLTQQGYDPGTAKVIASDKGALRSVILGRGKGNDFSQRAAAAQQYGLDPNTPEGRNFILTGKVGDDAPKPTDDMREYEIAKSQGFAGSFMDYMVKMKEAGRNQVNIDTGTKLPTGYMWIDPADQSKGVQPIPGGPATQIPAEAAGRIGLADTFLNNFDNIKQKVLSGDITGPIDAFRARNDSQYGGAETYRQIQSGVDALQRMLTGAGMPASEAANYAFRYLPTYTDNAESMATKLDRLKSELEGVKQRVLQGRGGAESQDVPGRADPSTLTGDAPPQGWQGKPELWKFMSPEDRALWMP